MLFKNIPIRKKLLRIILLINGIVLFVSCVAFFGYEYYIFRKATIEKLSIIGQMISANCTAALAFDNAEDAKEILAALKAESHVVSAGIYDLKGNLFSKYFKDGTYQDLPLDPPIKEYRFKNSFLEGSEPIMQDGRQ